MDKENIINKISGDLTINPGTAGDSWIQFSLITVDKFRMGVDDSDNQSFKISSGNDLGTNDTFVMTTDGELTMPLQSAFMARLESDDDDVTGDGTTYTIGTNTAWTTFYDQAGDFNTNGIFTAPITAKYTFESFVLLDGFDASHDLGFLTMNASNRDIISGYCNPQFSAFINQFYTFKSFISIDMDAADTMVMQITVSNGALVVDVRGTGTGIWTNFSGRLSV